VIDTLWNMKNLVLKLFYINTKQSMEEWKGHKTEKKFDSHNQKKLEFTCTKLCML